MLTVLGTTTVDIFVRGVEGLPELENDEFSNRSLVWLDNSVVPTLGGNGGNAAYAAGALGEDVRLWSAVGADPFGELALGWLRSRNVNTIDLLVSDEAGTATTVVLTDKDLRRNSFHYPGPINSFVPGSHVMGATGDWLLMTSYPLLLNWRGDAALTLLKQAKHAGVHTALDVGPILGPPVSMGELEPLLPNIDVLLCNEYELEQVIGAGMEGGVQWAISCGASAAVIKRGAQGAIVFSSTWSNGLDVPGFHVKVVGTVGAGDSFDVGFLYAYSRGNSIEESARFANAVAALVVSSPRGILDAPSADEVQAFLNKTSSK